MHKVATGIWADHRRAATGGRYGLDLATVVGQDSHGFDTKDSSAALHMRTAAISGMASLKLGAVTSHRPKYGNASGGPGAPEHLFHGRR